MKIPFSNSSERTKRHEIAAKWVMEADAGLSPSQQDALHEWFARDPRNREAFLGYTRIWGEFDRLAGLHDAIPSRLDKDFLKPNPQSRKWDGWLVTLCGVGIAASILFVLSIMIKFDRPEHQTISRTELFQRIEQLTFEDGSTCELKRGSEVEVAYSAQERRVRLLRGEAVFSVEKDPDRPFRVEVGALEVEALGTIFNVRNGSHQVDIIVTEGRVKLLAENGSPETGDRAPGYGPTETVINPLERASVSKLRGVDSVEITQLDEAALEEALIWRPTRLEFIDTPLSVIVNEFNRRNEIQIILGNEDLSGLRMTSFFWSDDVEAFVRLLERGFDTRVVWSDDSKIIINQSF